MLESTKSAYVQAVSDVVSEMEMIEKLDRIQKGLDTAAGEVVTGVSSWNTATTHAINRMKENGITGFIDHAGRHWSAEAYAAMDIRTTMANTARAAVWEQNENFGNDLYLVSYHNGARPLCYPWQNKVISSLDRSGVTYDLDGNEIPVYPQSSTSYGEPAGLFGIKCKHYPTPFIPRVSIVRGEPQDPEANEKTYKESQQQRALERKIREEKRDLMMLKAQGAPDEMIKAQRSKIRQTDDDIDNFCAETGRARRQNREGVYTKREFPSKDSYDVTQFEREQKEQIDKYFKDGGAQTGRTFSVMTPNEPVAPQTPPVVPTPEVPVQKAENESVNTFGESIKYHEKMMDSKYDATREQIATLASEFNTKLREVTFGAKQAAGDVDVAGSIMRLSAPKKRDVIIHEFAHTISQERQTKYGLYQEQPFWDEIRKIRTQYRKAVRDNPLAIISSYADADNKIDEFMAEGFALAYMREKGIEIPYQYGEDTVFSTRVLETIRKYFGK
jgi:hypothetical protein